MSANRHSINPGEENETIKAKAATKKPKPVSGFLALVFAIGALIFGKPELLGLAPLESSLWLSLGFSLVVTLGFGWKYWRGMAELFYRPNMNSLVGLGVVAAYGFSAWQWSQGFTKNLYFDSAAFVVAFVLLGHWVEKTMQQKIINNQMDETQKALFQQSDFQKSVDRWTSILVFVVVAISLGTAAYWYFIASNPTVMMTASISVLVIACPCAFGLATPLAYFVTVRRAKRAEVFIKNLNAIEKSSEVSVVAFDKTGTLTEGRPKVSMISSIENISHNEVLQLAHCLEQYSDHPYAKAINEAAQAENLKAFETRDIHIQPGKGLSAKVIKDNKALEICVGSLVWLFENAYETTDLPEKLRWEAEGSSDTVVWVAVDKKVLGFVSLTDPLRQGAFEMIQNLKDEGYEVGLITGDSENVASRIAKNLQLKFFHYGVMPSEKATIIRRLSEKKKKGLDFITPRVAFVGDGISDNPALAEAHLGIAVGLGSSVAQSSADLILNSNSLESVEKAFSLMNSANSLIRQNLTLAFAYNIIAIPVAAGVLYPFFGILLDPAVAAVAMSLGSVSVVMNSLRVLDR